MTATTYALRYLAFTIWAILLLTSWGPTGESPAPAPATADATASAPRRKVKVFFFHFKGFNDRDVNGNRCGYSYDFLQMIAGYLGVDFEYVGEDKSWSDVQELLDSGEVDLVTSAQKNPESSRKYAICNRDMGIAYTLLTTRAGNTRFIPNDFSTFNGMRVGMLKNNSRNAKLIAHADYHHYKIEPVYMDDERKIHDAMMTGSIDAMVTSDLRQIENETVLAKFMGEPYYAAARKEDAALIAEIDKAISALDVCHMNWRADLAAKYYAHASESGGTNNPAGMEKIRQMRERGEKLTVALCGTRSPYSFADNGKPAGYFVEMFDHLAQKIRIPYEYQIADNVADFHRLLQSGKPDIVLCVANSFSHAEKFGYRSTLPLLRLQVVRVALKRPAAASDAIALSNISLPISDKVQKLHPRCKLLFYPRIEAAIEALDKGEAKCMYTYAYLYERMRYKFGRYDVEMTPANDVFAYFSVWIHKRHDGAMYQILGETLSGEGRDYLNSILEGSLERGKEETALTDFFASHPLAAMTGLVISLMLLAATVLLCALIARNRRQKALALEKEEKMAAQLKTALVKAELGVQAKTNFLSRMSHDIRTPMNGIVGMTKLAQAHLKDSGKVEHYLDKITECSGHLLTLIDDVLNLSRIEVGKFKLAREKTDLRKQTAVCASILQSAVIGRDLKTEFSRAPLETPFVLTDELRLRQVIINLLSNAVKYTPDGGKISFRAENFPCDDGKHIKVRYTVADTGIGMSPEFQKHMFEPFAQVDESGARTHYKGAGLGMAIVKEYMDAFGGIVTVNSAPGSGTTATLDFTFELADGGQEPEAAAAAEDHDLTGMKILLVEDNLINCEVATEILEEMGASVTAANNGKEAVRVFARAPVNNFDYILMDVMMPVMDGYAATREIRGLDRPDAQTVPIIAMTANAFAEDVNKALESGMNAHLAKPLVIENLKATLDRFRPGGK